MAAEIDAAFGKLSRLEPDGNEFRFPAVFQQSGKMLGRRGCQPGLFQTVKNGLFFIHRKNQPVNSHMAFHDVLSDRATPLKADQFQIAVPEHDEMIHRTQTVTAFRRQRKTEAAEKGTVWVQTESGIDDKMVQ